MAETRFKQGEVFVYPYLWAWRSERGETEGRKARPVCLALPIQKAASTHLFLLAITGTRPDPLRVALEIPDIEKRRAGLKDWKVGWIILDEFNHDIVERSHYFDPSRPPMGRFSEAFTARIKNALRAAIAERAAVRIDRTDSP